MKGKILRRIVVATVLLPVALLALGNIVPLLAIRSPLGDTKLDRFDVIIVLGNPANSDGTPGTIMARRVEAAIALYRSGVASHLLFTGGPAHNRFPEARVMARLAQEEGIPTSAIEIEPKALNTYQNAFLCREIAQRHHWRSAAVVTSAYHSRRAGYIFSWYDLPYRVYPCDDGGDIRMHIADLLAGQRESCGLTWLLLIGSPRTYHLTPDQARRREQEPGL